MAITLTSGLEPTRYDTKSYRSVLESARRSVQSIQGAAGHTNPLETDITFPCGIFSITLTAAGSGYLSPPVISFVNIGSSSGSGVTATCVLNVDAIGALTLTAIGSGYRLAPTVVLTSNEIWTTFTHENINLSTNTITATEHGMSDNDHVHITTDAVLPMGLYTTDTIGNIVANPSYYIVNKTTDTFQLSLTSGGSVVDITSIHAPTATAYIGGGVVAGVSIDQYGANYITAPTISFSGGGGTGATATATIKDGMLEQITMIEHGSGYTSVPTVVFSGGQGTHTVRKGGGASITATIGSGATAVPITNAAGVITDVTMLTSGGGTGATATASLTGNNVTSLSITAGGSGYTSAPTVVFDNTGTGGSNATATATVTNGVITGLTIGNQGSGYTSAPTITFFGGGSYVDTTVSITGGGGTGATATATLLSGAVNDVTLTNNGTSYASLTSLVNRLLSIQTNLGAEINGTNSDENQINAWIAGTPPIAWTNAGYTDANLTSINTAIDAYQAVLVSCNATTNAILASITGTGDSHFLFHNKLLCGLTQTPPSSPFRPNFDILMSYVQQMENIEYELGVPFKSYLKLLLGCLFTGDDTIDTATGNLMTNPPWSAAPYDMGTYNVQSVISAGATTPSAITTVINGFTASVTAYNVLLSADNAAFTAHITNDRNEYSTAITFLDQYSDGTKHGAAWVDPYHKFMYTDVCGSIAANEIITDIDNEIIT